MSGIVGILNTDGAPVDARLLREMSDFLAFRGPDAQQIWLEGRVGLGHTLLKTTRESEREVQPFYLDSSARIVADARIDGRQDLIVKLRDRGHPDISNATDVELILRAYRVWGVDCVEHLLGDFAFAIWDVPRRRLFCARDQMGVKPFFYAFVGSCFIFSNTLDCLRQHPSVSDSLNDLAVADFLLFEMHCDPEATVFSSIQRLPPAHVLSVESGNLSVRRYWSLPAATPVHYARDMEYIERFHELLDAAVADRLRGDNAGVLMSGGLDSPTVAASAQRIFSRDGIRSGLHACTQVFDTIIPHEERHYARLVAEGLGIPIEFRTDDDANLFDDALHAGHPSPEPAHIAWPDRSADQMRQVAVHSRLALTGFGADPAFSCRITVYFRELLRARKFTQALSEAATYLMRENRFSRLYLRKRWQILLAPQKQSPAFPEWFDEDLEKRLGLRDRWETINQGAGAPGSMRREAHIAVAGPSWASLFENLDAGFTRVPVEARHPFFDLRLLNFLLGLPPLPWCSDKQLLREAARGILPEAVRLRRKSPLRAEPLIALLGRPEAAWVDRFEPVPELERYVVRNRIPKVLGEKNSWKAWIHLRPLSLNFWLQGRNPMHTTGRGTLDRELDAKLIA